jgi:hypothetical protein
MRLSAFDPPRRSKSGPDASGPHSKRWRDPVADAPIGATPWLRFTLALSLWTARN